MTDTAIVPTNGHASPLVPFTPEQVDLIKRTIAPNASDGELALFMAVCQRTGLDPFARQIYAIERKSKDRAGNWQSKMVIQTGIDGYRVTAERTGRLDGMHGPFWCGDDGKWVDVWLATTPPRAAKVGVLRRGCREPFWGVATMAEYRPGQGQDTMWTKMPAGQLAKCAEAQALRRAFPNDLSGLTTPETDVIDTDYTADPVTTRMIEEHDNARAARGRGEWTEEIDVRPTAPWDRGEEVTPEDVADQATPPRTDPAPPAEPSWSDDIAAMTDPLAVELAMPSIVQTTTGYHTSGALALAAIRLIELSQTSEDLARAAKVAGEYKGKFTAKDWARVGEAGKAARAMLAKVPA